MRFGKTGLSFRLHIWWVLWTQMLNGWECRIGVTTDNTGCQKRENIHWNKQQIIRRSHVVQSLRLILNVAAVFTGVLTISDRWQGDWKYNYSRECSIYLPPLSFWEAVDNSEILTHWRDVQGLENVAHSYLCPEISTVMLNHHTCILSSCTSIRKVEWTHNFQIVSYFLMTYTTHDFIAKTKI